MSLALVVMLPLVGAVLPLLTIRVGRNACALTTAAITSAALILLLSHVPAVLRGEAVGASWAWLPGLGLNASFFVDGLGLFFAGLILGIGLLIIAYARFYLADSDPMGSFYACLLLFQGAMTGIVLADNVLFLLVFWELTSLSSFLLIGYWKHLPEGRQGARMALVVTAAGGLSMIAGMLILGHAAGSYELTSILHEREAIQASPLYLPALLLILGGCFTKSAQFPFHFWLPHAMAAPTPVSAYLHSATMVKAGVFLLARLWPVLAGTPEWFYLVATTGLVTMVGGAVVAFFKDDLKALLAYSTVSHLGLMTMLLGFGTPIAAVAAVFHVLNHATFKAALFMSAGIVDHETGSRDMRQLGGLAALMPATTTIASVAAAAMAGVPLLNGFLSKEMMLEEALHTDWAGQDWVVPVLTALGAIFSVAYAFRYAAHAFFGPTRDDYPQPPHDPGLGMWLPPAALVVLVVLIGLFPAATAGPLVALTAGAVIGGPLPAYELALWHGFSPALGLSMLALVGGFLLLRSHRGAWATWQAIPQPEAKAMFDNAVAKAVSGARALIHGLHGGSLQRYLAVMIGAMVALGYAAFLGAEYAAGERVGLPLAPVAVVAWLVLVVASGVLVVLHRRRLLALVVASVIGLVISVALIYLSAPDLALTQISVEVVTVVLMLLALNLLPKTTPAESTPGRRARDGLLALLAGGGVGGLAWAVLTRDFETLSGYYLEHAVPGGGGKNVVNVILVDFRGYDTFGEITVLAIAAFIIYALLDTALKGVVGRRLAAWVPDQARARDRHPMMMVIATRALLPLALIVGAYIFVRGHNAPGGGFIAGLVVAIALIMQYMASGFGWAEQRMKVGYHGLIAAGISAAALTGIAPWLFGQPFLTSAFGHLRLPLIGDVELASAMAFDLGVFLTVVGAVMLALANLSRLGRLAARLPVNEAPMDVDPSVRRRRLVKEG